jgi:rSAM/selenodomain-associated transferase 2
MPGAAGPADVRISVVIPALNEGATIAPAIARLAVVLGDHEVIVVDGGSTDGTAVAVERAGAAVVAQPGSRAVAMNAGAARAGGGALLFLHADTTLPEGAGAAVRAALAERDGGAFTVAHDRRPLPFRFAAAAYRPFHHGVYGDQAIFVSREAFDRVGGYAPLPIMEDYDFVQRLRREGRFEVLPLSVTTSARRQRSQGEVRTLLRVGSIKLLYRLGVSPRWLAARYRPAR